MFSVRNCLDVITKMTMASNQCTVIKILGCCDFHVFIGEGNKVQGFSVCYIPINRTIWSLYVCTDRPYISNILLVIRGIRPKNGGKSNKPF